MATERNYLSEFEQEWNTDSETDTMVNEFELETDDERENDTDNEFEVEGEFESDYEDTGNNEFEVTATDSEYETDDEFEFETDDEVNPKYEDRLYAILTAGHESELEFEQQMNRVLHELETEYFFKALKRGWNKIKKNPLINTLKKVASKTPLGGVIKQYTALARGDIKSMLKGLAGQALSAAVPGGGIAKQLLNLEAPIANSDPRKNARIINQVAKDSYGNLVNQLATLPPSQAAKIKMLGKASFRQAWEKAGRRSGGNVRRITLRRGQKLVVRVI